MLPNIPTLIIATLTFLTSPSTAEDVGTSQVLLNPVTYGGSGCPQGSLDVTYTDNNLYADFHTFNPSTDPGAPITAQRKNCQLNIDLQYPVGVQYAPGTVTFKGHADLSEGVTATLKATWYFSGDSAQVPTTSTLTGPYHGDYEVKEDVPDANRVWSPCASSLPLNVNSQIRLKGSGGSVTNNALVVSGLVWRGC